MKTTIIYHSESGNTKQMAEHIMRTFNSFEGMEARTFSTHDVDIEFAKNSKCIIIGTPIYMAGASAAIHTFLQNVFNDCEPANKLGGAFATANYVHGGGELGIRSILDVMMVKGMLIYSGGAAFGKPVVHLGPVALSERLDESNTYFELYAKRMAQKAIELFG